MGLFAPSPRFPRRRVNRLSPFATDVRIDFGTSWSIRVCVRLRNEYAISYTQQIRLLHTLFEMPVRHPRRAYIIVLVFIPAVAGVGVVVVVVGQQAHEKQRVGFAEGSTWWGHPVAGITLARWLQLVVVGPRGPIRGPSLSLFQPFPLPPFAARFSLPRVVPPRLRLTFMREETLDCFLPLLCICEANRDRHFFSLQFGKNCQTQTSREERKFRLKIFEFNARIYFCLFLYRGRFW